MTQPDMTRIRDRLQKLMAITAERGAAEGEVEAAGRAIKRLLQEHGLTTAEVLIDRATVPLLHKRRHVTDVVWVGVAEAAAVVLVWQHFPERCAIYVGQAGRVEIAEYLHEVCLRALDRATADCRGRTDYWRATPARKRVILRAYMDGFATRLAERLAEFRDRSPAADQARQMAKEAVAEVPKDKRRDLQRRSSWHAIKGMIAAEDVQLVDAVRGQPEAEAALIGHESDG